MISSLAISGVVGSVLTVISFVIYLKSILRRDTRPHMFTWLLWALMTWIAFAIQFYVGAGPGAWITCVSALCTSTTFLYSIPYGDHEYKRSDWLALTLGLIAIPLWAFTNNPVWSAILVTSIDVFGYYPTIRKSWAKPTQESALGHAVPILKQVFSVLAIQRHSISATLYPAALLFMNTLLVAIICARRWYLGKIKPF